MKWKNILIVLGGIMLIVVAYYGYLFVIFNSAIKELVEEVQEISTDERHEEFREFLDSFKTEVQKELEYPIIDKVIEKKIENE